MGKRGLLTVLLAMALSLLLSGCGREEEEEGRIVFDVFGRESSFDGRGGVWCGSTVGLVQYYDLESGLGTVMCARPDCRHKQPTLADPDAECDAYYDGTVNCCFLYNGYLYVLYWSPEHGEDGRGFNNYTLCRADPDGTNRRIIAELDDLSIPTYYSVEDGLFAIGHHRQYDDKGEMLEKYACGVCVVDLESGKIIESPYKEEYSAQVFGIYLKDGIVTYEYNYFTETLDAESFQLEDGSGIDFDLVSRRMDEIIRQGLARFSIEESREEELWPGAKISVPEEDYVCVTGEDGQTLLYCASDGSSRPFPYSEVGYVRDGRMLLGRYIREKDTTEYFLYDLETGEESDLTILPECRYRHINAIAGGKALLSYDLEDGTRLCGWAEADDLYNGRIDSVDMVHCMGILMDFFN